MIILIWSRNCSTHKIFLVYKIITSLRFLNNVPGSVDTVRLENPYSTILRGSRTIEHTHTNKHRKHTQISQTNTNIANKHKYRKHTQISQTYTKNEISQPHIKLYLSQIDHRNNKLNIARHMNIQDIHKNDILQTHWIITNTHIIFANSNMTCTKFSQFVWPLSYSVWDVFNNFLLIDATDRSKISSDKKRFFIALSLYPLSFFANTPFNARMSSSYSSIFWFSL